MSRAMKKSGVPWIGDLPNEWQISKLKRCVAIRKRIAGETGRTVLSITQKGIVPKDLTSNEGQIAADYSNYQIVHPGDFAMNHMDLLTGWVDISRFEGVTSPDYRVFELVDKSRWSQRYLLHLLQTCYRSHIFYGLGQGVSGFGRWRLPADMFLHFDIPCPEISEQQRIADFLDIQTQEVDAAIVKTRESIEEYKKLKQAVITQAVTKGIRPNRSMKDSGVEWIGEIPEEWAVKPLLFYFLQRKNQNSLGTEKNLLSLSYGEIIQKDINTSFGLLPENFNGYNIVERDDIVLRLTDLQNDQKSMRTGLVKARGIITSAYVTIHAVRKINASYFQKLLHAADVCKFFYNLGSGVRQSLKYSDLTQIRLLEPSLSEQQEIVAYLDEKCGAIDALIEKKQQIVTELESYKKSLIYEYVTGKKEVPA